MVHLDRDPNALANTVLHGAPEEPKAKVEDDAVEEKPAAKPAGLTTHSASALLGDRKVNE